MTDTSEYERPFSPDTLAERWGCSSQHIRDLIRAGKLESFRIGRLIRIPAAAVKKFETPNLGDATIAQDRDHNGHRSIGR
jgi:excisionase family DNA binding protein